MHPSSENCSSGSRTFQYPTACQVKYCFINTPLVLFQMCSLECMTWMLFLKSGYYNKVWFDQLCHQTNSFSGRGCFKYLSIIVLVIFTFKLIHFKLFKNVVSIIYFFIFYFVIFLTNFFKSYSLFLVVYLLNLAFLYY